ncbi:MAG: thioesterase family protein [Anaerolineales bacterium]|nr:thioesterase family protein [Anaerolineales bacterium]
MELSEIIKPGMMSEKTFSVEERHSAVQAGSGGVAVLATPWMIAFMENAAFNLLESVLPDGFSSVGVLVEVRHLAPTPIGGEVRVQVEVTEVEDSGVSFGVRAWDKSEQIGQGVHLRGVVEKDRFLKRVNAKKIK